MKKNRVSNLHWFVLVVLFVLPHLGCGHDGRPANEAIAPSKEAKSDPFGGARGCFALREIGSAESLELGGEECGERSLPASTFKIPNALIAIDLGILQDEKSVLPWDGKARWNADWNRDHSLSTAMWYSVVWYFQDIATKVGTERYKKYLESFDYGNADPSGDVTMFWLDKPLSISPREQIRFLQSLYTGKLPVSPKAMEVVKKTLELRGDAKEHVRKRLPFVDEIPENVVLSGKTGSALPDDDKALGPVDVVGWFVGAVQRDGRQWVFATRIRSNDAKRIGPEAARIAYGLLRERGLL